MRFEMGSRTDVWYTRRMATTTKKSQAKTKTTKTAAKPARAAKAATTAKAKTTVKKPAAKPAAKKTTAKTKAAKPAIAKKTSAPVATAAEVTTPVAAKPARKAAKNALTLWHLVSGIVLALLAVIAGLFVKTTYATLTLGHVAKDDLASKATTVFAPAQQGWYDIDLRWALVAVLGVAALAGLLRGTVLRTKEQAAVARSVNAWRWVSIALTFGLLTGLVALLVGVREALTLKLIVLSVVAGAVFGWLAEREKAGADRQTRALGIGSVAAFAVAALSVGSYLLNTWIYGLVRYPWYAYVAAGVVTIGLLAIVLTQRRLVRGAPFAKVERNYAAISLVTAAALAVTVILGLRG